MASPTISLYAVFISSMGKKAFCRVFNSTKLVISTILAACNGWTWHDLVRDSSLETWNTLSLQQSLWYCTSIAWASVGSIDVCSLVVRVGFPDFSTTRPTVQQEDAHVPQRVYLALKYVSVHVTVRMIKAPEMLVILTLRVMMATAMPHSE